MVQQPKQQLGRLNLKNTAIEQKLKSISYVFDGYLTTIPVDSNLCLPYKGSVELANLTEGTHQLIVYTNATGVYRSFRGFFAQTQINDSNKTAIVFTFTPTPSPTPLSNQESFPAVPVVAVSVVAVALVVAGLLVYHKNTNRLSQVSLTEQFSELVKKPLRKNS